MSEPDQLTWYISVSPFNRYLVFDILRAIGLTAIAIAAVIILPTPIILRDFVVDVGGLVLIIYLFSTLMRLFWSFTGTSIRFILDAEGVTAMTDHETSGMKYVARQVSSMSWDPKKAGWFGRKKVNPRVPRLAWSDVSKVSEDPKRGVVVLHSWKGSIRLFTGDRYDEVVSYVNKMMNAERYL